MEMKEISINFTKLKERPMLHLSGWNALEHAALFGAMGNHTPDFHNYAPVKSRMAHPYIEAWSRLNERKMVTSSGCWEYSGSKYPNGYGHVHFMGRDWRVHRLSFFLSHGWIPSGAGVGVFHKCDNPPCFNPDHLFWGTQQDNMDDRDKKGRHGSKRLDKVNASSVR